jgi:hypothetical protein
MLEEEKRDVQEDKPKEIKERGQYKVTKMDLKTAM